MEVKLVRGNQAHKGLLAGAWVQAQLQQTGKPQHTRLPEAWGVGWTGRDTSCSQPRSTTVEPKLTTPSSVHLRPRQPWRQVCSVEFYLDDLLGG